MHARHHNGAGIGYRSNAMGLAASSRISPEGSMRGHRMYNPEYRNYNRGGYGCGGHTKQSQPPLQPPHETDIFMEAGRLAAEYLVTKGILPPNALLVKWRNGDIKNQIGDFHGFKPHEGETMRNPMDSRAFVQSHLGTASVDVGFGRRMYSEEYNLMGSKNSMKGRRIASLKNYGSERNPDLLRSGSLSDRGRTSPSMEADSDVSVRHHDKQPMQKDGDTEMQKDGDTGMQNSSASELTQQSGIVADLESILKNLNSVDDVGGKPSYSSTEKEVPSNDDMEPVEGSDSLTISNAESEKDKERSDDNDLEQHAEDMEITATSKDDSLASEDNVDLIKNCKFANVHTKTRSSLAIRGSKVDLDPITEDEFTDETKLSESSDIHVIDVPINGSTHDASSHQSLEANSLSDALKAPAMEEELGVAYTANSGHCSTSGPFPEKSVINAQEINKGLPAFGSCNSMFMERGKKRSVDDGIDCREGTKRPRERVPTLEIDSDACLHLSNSMENQQTSEEPMTSHGEHATLSTDQKSLDISLFPKSQIESCEYTEEKQLFPCSFKTCDLNLVENCDVNENDAVDPILMFQSITETGKQAAPVDIDLSMSNSCNVSNKYGNRGFDDKDIEVIDLEIDSVQEDKTYTNPERRGDTVFMGLDGFPNNVHNGGEILNIQDGYGLMISEFLANSSPNFSVPTDLNSLHNDMGLHNGEGILGDDDSIYMSLGEIPTSFLSRPWEQPTQEYEKPF